MKENNEVKTSEGDQSYKKQGSRDKDKTGFRRSGTFFKVKKECYFTKNHINFIDYKNVDLLKRFLGKSGRILPRRITGTKMIHQRKLANAVKRARYMALLPYVGSIWSQEYYEQKNRDYIERKRQNQMKEQHSKEEKKQTDFAQKVTNKGEINGKEGKS